ncbi:J domain-containing protein [uncultured Desulfobacter sp.]|uniref:J domain-containing protein n=1 Tax=uncultured Desulfobacter sp. TaxID=240139 RepID=UPI002AAC39BB|nr:J domain-containing protein [uncultured Desulfobacter sp.]
MDKHRGLDILGLAPSASCADARAAFRRLVKIWHPDKFAKDPQKAKIAEEKMKQINDAFHFLLPLLADADIRTGVGQNPLNPGHACDQTRCGRKRSQGFFSFLASGLKKRFSERKWVNVQETRRTGQTCRDKPVERNPKTQFETMFQNAVNHRVNHRQTDVPPQFQSPKSVRACNVRYGKGFTSTPGYPVHMIGRKNRGMGPVEKISPISPVSPVQRGR